MNWINKFILRKKQERKKIIKLGSLSEIHWINTSEVFAIKK